MNDKINISLQPGVTENDQFSPIGEPLHLSLENRNENLKTRTEERVLDNDKVIVVDEVIHNSEVQVFDVGNKKLC